MEDKLAKLDNPQGEPGKHYIGLLFNTRGAAEPITRPHTRVAPIKKDRLQKLCSAYIKARGDETGTLPMGDAFICFDGGKQESKQLSSIA